ncbi:hypothetical protein SAMN06297144_2129 [Sphingomonas guangdongensis]|uniref:MobA-like NTP transferase domain-containing protein n=1 Tax=Sphingomonas guangdongensis TaxID=1141890 RepID=A0A285R022_9SPHN|nr:hypothetical protein [Sphingomonas guangdongensis]SOB87009.1 hypothetical protein SAMN06297144_2129 [Sphingomonas guangdongensis]
MLAGLIFATEDAEDRPDTLAATLPFGGSTLIEYQARLLAAVGVTHILVAVGRVTPALLGATSRIAGRGVTVDVVRTAQEAAAKVHPLAQVIVVADGLVTTDAVIEWIGHESHEALLVARDGDGCGSIERVDSSHCWAGLARVPARRLADVAAMPADYDFASTLLRHATQAGAVQLLLPPATGRTRHGVERTAAALLRRSKSVLAALGDRRTAWIDRFVFTPVTGFALPHLVARSIPAWGILAAAAAACGGALVAFFYLLPALGLALASLAAILFSTGSLLSWLRGEDRVARWQERAIAAVAGTAVLALGLVSMAATGTATGISLALPLIAAAALLERVAVPKRRWWPVPGAYPLLLFPFAAAGLLLVGLAGALAYAFVALGDAVERGREQA